MKITYPIVKNAFFLMFILAIGLVLLIRSPQFSTAATSTSPDFYTTKSFAELEKTLPLTTGSPYIMKVIYSIPLDKGVQAGDLLDVTVDMEVTSPHRYNVMYASQVLLTNSPTAVKGQIISRPSGYNLSPAMHHGKDVRVGKVRVASTDTTYVNYVGWTASTAATPDATLIVEQNYGIMTVTNWGPVS